VEVEAPKHTVEAVKEKAVKKIDESCDGCGDKGSAGAEEEEKESGPPGEDEADGPVLSVNAKIKKAL